MVLSRDVSGVGCCGRSDAGGTADDDDVDDTFLVVEDVGSAFVVVAVSLTFDSFTSLLLTTSFCGLLFLVVSVVIIMKSG